MLTRGEGKESEYLVDSHCHILPGIDDGASDMDETLKMLKIAASEGITHIVATPHFKINHHHKPVDKIEETLEEVKKAARENNIDIKIFLGNEVRYFNDIEIAYEEKRFSTMNSTDYLLVEFYPDDEFKIIRDALETVRSLGLIPIVAHVERYSALRSMQNARLLHKSGVILSVNASTIIGGEGLLGKMYAKKLLKEKIVSLVTTDSHDTDRRAPRMANCREYLYSHYDEEYVDSILYKNAMSYFNLEQA